jgi:hypothetical protein
MLSEVGESAYVHAAPAACVSDSEAPPIEIVALRAEAVPFAAAV